LDIAKHKAELKKNRGDEHFFGEVYREKIKIGDNSAIVISYEFNDRRKKGKEGFNFFLQRIENCYVKLKDKTLLLNGSTYTKDFDKTVKGLWEEFYKSYREDDSQAFKTNYGSFKWVNGLEDESSIEYFASNKDDDLTLSIEISYLSEEDKIESKGISSFTEKTFEFLSKKIFASKVKSDKLIIDGYKIEYDEFKARISNDERGRWAYIRMSDFTPGIEVMVNEERMDYFGMYRNELNAMIKSIKFYPDLKKSR